MRTFAELGDSSGQQCHIAGSLPSRPVGDPVAARKARPSDPVKHSQGHNGKLAMESSSRLASSILQFIHDLSGERGWKEPFHIILDQRSQSKLAAGDTLPKVVAAEIRNAKIQGLFAINGIL